MTAETTAPIAIQGSAVQLLADLIEQHANLPAAYIVVNAPFRGRPSTVDLQLSAPAEFEQWRTALGIGPGDVTLNFHASDSFLDARAVRGGIRLHVYAHGVRLTAAEFTAPRDREQVPA